MRDWTRVKLRPDELDRADGMETRGRIQIRICIQIHIHIERRDRERESTRTERRLQSLLWLRPANNGTQARPLSASLPCRFRSRGRPN